MSSFDPRSESKHDFQAAVVPDAWRSAALLHAIVDSSDDAIISKDLNGVITSWNKSAERLFGYTADEIIGRPITLLIPPDRLDEEPKILDQLKRGERVDHFETIRVRKDGSKLHISLTISPIRDGDGRIVGASKIARDISERRQAEVALSHRHAQFETLLNQSPVGVYLVDSDFRIREVNPLARPVFGDIADLIGRDFDEVIHRVWHQRFADEMVALFRHTLDTGDPYIAPERGELPHRPRHDRVLRMAAQSHYSGGRPLWRGVLQPRYFRRGTGAQRAARLRRAVEESRSAQERVSRDLGARTEKSPGADPQRRRDFQATRSDGRGFSDRAWDHRESAEPNGALG